MKISGKWNIFLQYLYPTLCDFELSVRKGDWDLFIAAVRRCLPIFFAMGRTNYRRWAPLFYQDCLDLQSKFPDLYQHSKKGFFVCYLTKRSTLVV